MTKNPSSLIVTSLRLPFVTFKKVKVKVGLILIPSYCTVKVQHRSIYTSLFQYSTGIQNQLYQCSRVQYSNIPIVEYSTSVHNWLYIRSRVKYVFLGRWECGEAGVSGRVGEVTLSHGL